MYIPYNTMDRKLNKRIADYVVEFKKTIKEQFFEAVEVFNNSIFDNKKTNISINKNFTD